MVMAESETPPRLEAAVATVTASTAAQNITSSSPDDAIATPRKAVRPHPTKPSIHQIYALPAPVRTFPLPAFHPTNPLSLIYLVLTWISQTVSTPVEPYVIYDGIWYPETRSVHVIDAKSMRALWEQGFYGKGSLSRSEPHWLDRQKAREGLIDRVSSETLTAQRREERQRTKWERARNQQEAIEQTRREEAKRRCSNPAFLTAAQAIEPAQLQKGNSSKAPVGPLELLMMPNSHEDWEESRVHKPSLKSEEGNCPPIAEAKQHSSPEKTNGSTCMGEIPDTIANGHTSAAKSAYPLNSVLKMPSAAPYSDCNSDDSKSLKRQKSVRFSPTIESTTFKLSDPPNPNVATQSIWRRISSAAALLRSILVSPQPSQPMSEHVGIAAQMENKEHLQLTPEEAFFLTFAFGSLRILDPSTKDPIPPGQVVNLFRQHSYFPPQISDAPGLGPDDPFLLHYVVYHHFRSMGWCVRPGIKFGVDWLLYLRGPVFNHAEFGVLVLPSYSHQWWKDAGQQAPPKSWNWLSGIIRTLSQVFKSLILVYVDIPPPPVFEATLENEGIAGALQRFKVREIMMGRWLHNRNRSVHPGPEAKRNKCNEKEKANGKKKN